MLNRIMKGIGNPLSNRQQINMVLQRLSAVTGLPSSISRNWRHIAVRTFPLIIGAMALTTTLLFGSFLWGYISRKTKHSREKPVPFKDLYPHASHKPNTVITVHDFSKPVEPPSPLVSEFDNNTYFDALVFDPEHDYAQVLAEARTHAATTMSIPANPAAVAHSSSSGGSSKAPWVSRSHSARHHNPFLEDLEAMFPQHKDSRAAGGLGAAVHDRFRSGGSRSWKKLMFWKKGKKVGSSGVVEFELGSGVLSSCATPLHHAFKSKMRATVTPTGGNNSTTGSSSSAGSHHRTKRAISGPVYSDGIPYIPASRAGRPCSGPLSGSSTPSREGLYESPYMALKKPGNGAGLGSGFVGSTKSPSGPLYVT
ncbi:hypothetical protein MPTK1_2g22050 [Marchantia polymorpha subsp. ruderalis]|uniref:Uncharacterized protein n=1 Tax=Marchantia polymorpha TaxID=3197 RepID=A0A2R6X2I4_MARPO|nr:hypothetical protein MARPO_0040s0010 [Marchantia polymorpha]BBN03253.1 hypothetical protein Mp_2g22050 [Marchantia polymorpha subsp. ruderalis]|eukprot:PTQ40324.1 hypothetical protein MARPO_0040s0010 [Marchantia polymorpha]